MWDDECNNGAYCATIINKRWWESAVSNLNRKAADKGRNASR